MRFLFLQLPPISPDGVPARENHPLGAARYGGELVAELLDVETADLLADAGFHTVEVGVCSTSLGLRSPGSRTPVAGSAARRLPLATWGSVPAVAERTP